MLTTNNEGWGGTRLTDEMRADGYSDGDIARDWPDRWERANNPTLRGRSKARNNLRKAYRGWRAQIDFMRANPTASCLNCQHRKQMPLDTRFHCELDSDFHGYAVLASNNPCVRHQFMDPHHEA